MTIQELVRMYYEKNPDGHYFDHDTLKFFGERISDMRVSKSTVPVTDICGLHHTAYQVSRLQRKPSRTQRRSFVYFDTETLEDIIMP